MNYFRHILYYFLRLTHELLNIIQLAIKSIEARTIIVYIGVLGIGASCILVHTMAKNQNRNYIDIMNHTISEGFTIFNYESWHSEDILTDLFLSEFCKSENLGQYGISDNLSRSSVKSPTTKSYLYLTSLVDPESEEALLDELYINHNFDIEYYLYQRYLSPANQNIEDEDYYMAQKQVNRYFKLFDKYCESKPLNSEKNHIYLIRLLLQDRWALTCNREIAQKLFSQTSNIADHTSHDSSFSSSYDSSFDEYISYVKGLELIKAKSYSLAYEYYTGLFETSSPLFKEHNSFMIIRSAFWIFDRERTQNNRKIFMDAIKRYSPHIESKYLKVDIEYYRNIVAGCEIIQM